MRDPGIRIRAAVPLDAARLLELKLALDRETSFRLLEPDERTEATAEVAAELEEIERRANCVVLVAEEGDSLCGYVEAAGGGSVATVTPRTSSSASGSRPAAAESGQGFSMN
jgi:hypothetical protein